jgi:NADH-quinone oxidoreductase subunit J
MLLEAEFLAITLVLVYVGAVMVLFLFVVMMLDVKIERMREGFWRHFPLAAVVGVLVIFEMSAVLMGGFTVSDHPKVLGAAAQTGAEVSNTRELGLLMYRYYIYPLEVAAALLLVAMIAAIALTLRHRKDVKTIDPSLQVHVKSKDRLVVVKMATTQPALQPDVVETPPGEKKV